MAVPGSAPPPRPPGWRHQLDPLLADPGSTAILTDFDGTLSAIVDDPAGAALIEGAADVLARLADRFAVVAVISGRPVSFLQERLHPIGTARTEGAVGGPGAGRIHLVGLYGLEQSVVGGPVVVEAGVEPWRDVVDGVVARLRATAPPGVMVEPKGLTVTVHWRNAPDAAAWAEGTVADEAGRTGLQPHPGRMSSELRPPVPVDKGSVVRRLVAGCTAACYLGDDLGDLPAFAALSELATGQGMGALAIAVVDDESDPRVAAAADLVLDGPTQALDALRWMADAAAGSPG